MQSYQLNSILTITTVGTLHKSMVALINNSSKLDIDLSNINKIDSSGVALLLDLIAIAKKKNCQLHFTNTPEIVKRLCQLYKTNI